MKRFPSVPPPSMESTDWTFPNTAIRTLANGAQIAVIQMPALPIITVRWCFLSGRLHEPAHGTGAGFLLQRLLRHGTEERSSADFARYLDGRGIRLGTQVSVDSTVISVSAVREYVGEAIRIANAVAFNPLLPEAALSVERIRAIQMHQQAMGQVEALMTAGLARALYGDHPYGRPVTTRSGLANTQVMDIRSLHGQICDPSRALLIVVGDMDPGEVMDVLTRRVSELSASEMCRDWSPPTPVDTAPSVVVVEQPDAEQVAIGVGAVAMPRNHPDFLVLRVVNHILGGGAASRLFGELRERQGLTYGAYSQLDCGRWGGDLTASMLVEPSKLNRALSALSKEMVRISAGGITNSELNEAVDYLVGSFPQRASGLAGVSSLAMAAWLHGLPANVWHEYQTALRRVTIEQVELAARTWLSPDRLSWVVCGPSKALNESCERLESLGGPVQRVDRQTLLD